MRDFIWQQKPWQAFKNFAIIFSFAVNVVVLLVLLLAAPLIVPVVDIIVDPLVGGLADSFVEMKEASIRQTIVVDDQIPVVFDLPLQQNTEVVLTRPVALTAPAQFVFPAGGGTINGTVNITLPEGQVLPIRLDMLVEVDQQVPVNLNVPVDIPLDETELGAPFRTLEGLFTPLDGLLQGLPDSNDELLRRVGAATRTDEETKEAEAVGAADRPR